MKQLTSILSCQPNKFFIYLIIFLITMSTLLFAESNNSIVRNFVVNNGGTLTVDVKKASISVRGKEGNEVNVKVSWKVALPYIFKNSFNRYDLEFGQSGNDVSIILLNKDHITPFLKWLFGGILKIHIDIIVPEKYNLDISTSGRKIIIGTIQGDVKTKTSGGSIVYESIDGSIVGKTSGGSITLESCSENVELRTSGGKISLGSVEGNVIAKTSGGSIHAKKCGAHVDAQTSGGSIQLNDVTGPIDISTSGGSISVDFTKQPNDDCRLKTSGGSITVSLPKNVKAELDAQTTGGRVKTDFPITVQGEIDNHKLLAALNGGGPLISLKTSGGSISIHNN